MNNDATLNFGTGGLRAHMGEGDDCMNARTVARVTRGLAGYLNENFDVPRCAVAYDSRNNSELFAETTARTLADAGVVVYLFQELTPTPILTFAVRELGLSCGVVITASHNSKEYNGYKVYGADGCQITPPTAKIIKKHMDAVTDFPTPPSFDELSGLGKIKHVSADIFSKFYNNVLELSVTKPQNILNIVYSPLNGTGNTHVRTVLEMAGYTDVQVVREQELPDGNFPTCPHPNPENKDAMALCVKYAQNADIFIATDPDCDRVGAGIVTPQGVKHFSGDEIGILLFEYICKARTAANSMPENPIAIKTIVTTDMANLVAKNYGVELINVLTGFKYIGEYISDLEQKNESHRFVFGFEESCGYLAGSFLRDKDGIIASMLICEMAAYYKSQGKTLVDALHELNRYYGNYLTEQISFALSGACECQNYRTTDIISALKSKFMSKKITKITDFATDYTGLPASNLLRIQFDDGCVLAVRPSGTEPKIKVYLTAVGVDTEESERKMNIMKNICRELWLCDENC